MNSWFCLRRFGYLSPADLPVPQYHQKFRPWRSRWYADITATVGGITLNQTDVARIECVVLLLMALLLHDFA